MPLFKCNKCDVIENTAVGHYWGVDKGQQECSQCHTGTWHGLFPRKLASESPLRRGTDNFYHGEQEFIERPSLEIKEPKS